MHENLHFDKFEGADIKYINSFSNLQPKMPKFAFFFWTIFCISAILRMLISNITTVFQVYGQNTEIRHFWFHFMLLLLSLLLFCSIFGIWINSRVLISNMALAFSNFSLKILKRAFLVQIPILFLHKTLHFDKFEGADFKYGNNFSNLQPKIIQIRHFWFHVWKLFYIKYCLMTYSKVLMWNVTIVLQNASLQITQKHFCPKFNVFLVFHEKFFWQFWGCS